MARKTLSMCLFVTVFVPIVIHLVFKVQAPTSVLEAEWSAGELLDYTGSLLGAIATIIAVMATIHDERQGRMEEQRLSSVPLIVLIDLAGKAPEANAYARDNDTDSSSEFSLEKEYIVINSSGNIGYQNQLTNKQRELCTRSSHRHENPFEEINKSHYIPLRLMSAGNGSAINATAWMEKNGKAPLLEDVLTGDGIPRDTPLELSATQLMVGRCRHVGILFEDYTAKEACGDYEIVLRYYDVMGNQYEQRHAIRMYGTRYTIDFKINRKLIKRADSMKNIIAHQRESLTSNQ